MRRIRAAFIFALLLAAAGALFADYEVRGKDVYVINRPIAKIYSHQLGYKIVFVRENYDFSVFYVPLKWFGTAGGRGQIVWGTDAAYPTFTAVYIDGKFDHIRLYLLSNLNDATWAVLSATPAEEKMFDVETLDIKY